MHFAEKETAAQKIEWPIQIQLGGIWLSQEEKPECQPKGERSLKAYRTKEKQEQGLCVPLFILCLEY